MIGAIGLAGGSGPGPVGHGVVSHLGDGEEVGFFGGGFGELLFCGCFRLGLFGFCVVLIIDKGVVKLPVVGFVVFTNVPGFLLETELYGLLIGVKVPDFIPLLGNTPVLVKRDSRELDLSVADLEFGGLLVLLVVLA
jgi:hypothetical protein